MRATIKKDIREAKRQLERNIADKAKEDPKRFFQYFSSKRTVKEEVKFIRNSKGQLKDTDYEIADALNLHFSEVFISEQVDNLPELPGRKDLFIEADLMSPLDRIANVSILKQHEVDKLYRLDNKPVISSCNQLCFLIRPHIQAVKWISDVTCDEWEFYFLPLDDDIISLELPEFFRDYFLDGDQRWVSATAKALHYFHSLFGLPLKVYGIGKCAKVFNEIRNEHFSNVFGFLSQKAKNLQTAYDKRQGMDIKQMKNFVSEELKGLKQEHRLLSLPLLDGFNVRESISYIEEHIIRQLHFWVGLTTSRGVETRQPPLAVSPGPNQAVEDSKSHGALREVGESPSAREDAIKRPGGGLVSKDYRSLKSQYLQIPKSNEEYDLHSPPDMAYIFSGAYIPLSCKLIEQVLERDGWNGLEEVARMLNGNEFAVTGGGGAGEAKPKPQSSRLMFVIFLGGCTFSEISALRFLGKQKAVKHCFDGELSRILRMKKVLRCKCEVLAAESVACLNKALSHLKDIWEEIGISEDQRLERTEVVNKHIKGLLNMMIAEEESLKARLLKSITVCRKELDSVCVELQLAPFEEEEGSTILQTEKDIRTRLEVMKKQKRDRMQELKNLKEQELDLCDILSVEPYSIQDNCVPSLDELGCYRQYIASLNEEKVRRTHEFINIKKKIVINMEELEHLPDTSFERDVVCEDEDAFCLSTDNIAALKQLLNQLEAQKLDNEAVCKSYRNKVLELWDRLQIPQEFRDSFSCQFTDYRKKDIQALKDELERLEDLKMQNIQNVIKTIREEIALYWEKCFISSAQRKAFTAYYDEVYTEDLLYVHDSEILQLKQYYSDHAELFEGVCKWQENWKVYLELEAKATDPSRFNNRGGNLLKEEKQRADLLKLLPKLEKKLKAEIDTWEGKNSQEFQVNGQKFLQFVEEQWEMHRLDKEREKQERLGQPLRTAVRSKPPLAGQAEDNKENLSHFNGTTKSGALKSGPNQHQHFSINSVAGSYSEFALTMASKQVESGQKKVLKKIEIEVKKEITKGGKMFTSLLIYQSENPRAFKQHNVNKARLPVMWRVTRAFFWNGCMRLSLPPAKQLKAPETQEITREKHLKENTSCQNSFHARNTRYSDMATPDPTLILSSLVTVEKDSAEIEYLVWFYRVEDGTSLPDKEPWLELGELSSIKAGDGTAGCLLLMLIDAFTTQKMLMERCEGIYGGPGL
ncbi:PRC1 regulator, partial [Polypterus senegalus]